MRQLFLVLAVVGLIPATAAAQAPAPATDFPSIARLEEFVPGNNELRCGGEVTAIVQVSAAPQETVHYFGFLTVNGLPMPPFTLTLLTGDITVRQEIHWPVKTKGKNVAIRFRLIAIGETSKKGQMIAEVAKDYKLGKIRRGEPQGCY